MQAECHSTLHLAAAQCYMDADWQAAAALFAAAFQYAPASERGRTARMLAVCYQHLKQPQRTLEYLAVGEQADPQLTAVGQLLRLQAAVDVGDVETAIQGGSEQPNLGKRGAHTWVLRVALHCASACELGFITACAMLNVSLPSTPSPFCSCSRS